ncbi:MAG: MOSC domain-containing protein [Dehalococcoidia bacterium]
MASVVAVCRSHKKGVRKEPVNEGVFIEGTGLIDDAHADSRTHRQVSLLAVESINRMRNFENELKPGDFAANLTTEGIELKSLPVGTRLAIGEEVLLEVSQIGKECHTRCAIYRQVGQCIMPAEGIFALVVCGGVVRGGDRVCIA